MASVRISTWVIMSEGCDEEESGTGTSLDRSRSRILSTGGSSAVSEPLPPCCCCAFADIGPPGIVNVVERREIRHDWGRIGVYDTHRDNACAFTIGRAGKE